VDLALPGWGGPGTGTNVERTLEHDVRFGVRQLVDIACKALPLAINDPCTRVQATDRLSVLPVELPCR
jgi:uncharacterized membrane protein